MATQKLLPPTIESKLPAQIGDIINIPFLHNRSVSPSQYSGMILKLKTISTNLEIASLEGDAYGNFKLTNNNILTVGQHYKAQIAYKSVEGVIGYFSTVGVFKYTKKPNLTISSNGVELDASQRNVIGSIIYGHYFNEDKTEKVYSYCFNIYKNDELFLTSGELLHNSLTDNTNESSDSYSFNYELDSLSVYKIEYQVTTMNNLTQTSGLYYIGRTIEVPNSLNFLIEAIPNNEVGGINICMLCEGDIQGRFRLIRSHDNIQEIIREFVINDIANGRYNLDTDYTVEQGVEYIYSVQQYNDNFVTELVESKSVQVDFEDIFLFDGQRQLKIKFNPKVSSFKNTILESKLDTIGGQYPFIFRNGRTKYKEFPISGLISYQMDNEELFLNGSLEDVTTNLTGENIAQERIFKLSVLEWLNNGQPKLFRSPTEGNYIVRLLNVSLSPDDALGRMLHSFNCTAYEIAEYNYNNLKNYQFIGYEPMNYNNLWRFFTIDEIIKDTVYSLTPALWIRIYGDIGSEYELSFINSQKMNIRIGVTGMYEAFFSDNFLTSIKLKTNKTDNADFSYKIEYATTQVNMDAITYNGQQVTKILSYEYGASFDTPKDIIKDIIHENETLDNILFLRLERIGNEEANENVGKIEYTYIDGTSGSIILHSTPIGMANMYPAPWNQIILGRIELTANDFDGRFLLKSLNIGPDIKADIYYRVKKIETEVN